MSTKVNVVTKNVTLLPDPHFLSPVKQDNISLQPFPYPYRAGMAICNDIDNTSKELFNTLHQFLNTNQETANGSGLNLEIGDSFWFLPNAPHVMGMDDTTDKEQIIQLNKAGWLDSLHTYGDFNDDPCCSRERINSICDCFTQHKVSIPVWINHGNANNRHNLWGRLASSYSGDLPDSPYYHFDLTKKHGVKYYWWSEISSFPLSCAAPHKMAFHLRKFEVLVKNSIKQVTGNVKKIRDLRQPFELALPVQLRDGNKIWGFTRYNQNPNGEWSRPGRHTLKYQLTEHFLKQLIAQKGYCILYTHFGQPSWQPGTPLFDTENLAALKRLAEKNRNNQIWLTRTAQLLRYWVTRHHLVWNTDKEGKTYRINIQEINDPVEGARKPSREELTGITFSTPHYKNTELYIQNKKEPVKRWLGPDSNSSHGFVGVPIEKIDTSLFRNRSVQL